MPFDQTWHEWKTFVYIKVNHLRKLDHTERQCIMNDHMNAHSDIFSGSKLTFAVGSCIIFVGLLLHFLDIFEPQKLGIATIYWSLLLYLLQFNSWQKWSNKGIKSQIHKRPFRPLSKHPQSQLLSIIGTRTFHCSIIGSQIGITFVQMLELLR